jgi:N-acetylmuramoyl-L-alanine amidase
MQKRLLSLGYWLVAADGNFGVTTQQAVLALQKAAGTGRDGVAGPQTLDAMARGVRPSARSTSGHVLEIDKNRQLLLVVDNGVVTHTIATSTGSYAPYTQQGQQYIAETPNGHFSIFRQVDGDDPGPLGDLYRPKYFNAGIAVHGYNDVPAEPASHGCARVSEPAMDYLWSSGLANIGAAVWVY